MQPRLFRAAIAASRSLRLRSAAPCVDLLEARTLMSAALAPALTPTDSGSVQAATVASPSPTDTVSIPDAGLQAAVRTALNKPTGDITIADMQSLVVLDADNRDISSMEGLQYATNLSDLEIGWNQISDLTPISGLTRLDRLFLFSNNISDITPLSGLTNVTSLYLGSNRISNVQPLSGMTNLIVLYLVDNGVLSDITPLSNLTGLSSLILGGNRISDITPLKNMNHLLYLELDRNNLTDISTLSSLTTVQSLTLYGNQITDISPLSGMVNMQSLQMQNNQISNLATLADMPNLQTLDVAGNQVSDLSPIAGLKQLKTVDVSQNNLDTSPNSAAMGVVNALIDQGANVQYEPQSPLPQIAPPAPTGLTATANDWPRSVTLTWTDVNRLETAYSIERSTNGRDFGPVTTLPANSTTFTDTNVTPGQIYFYRLDATNDQGASPFVTTRAVQVSDLAPVPANLSATAAPTGRRVTLTWDGQGSLATQFNVLRSTDGIHFSRVALLRGTATGFVDTHVRPGGAYSYELRSVNRKGPSAASAPVSLTTPIPPRPATHLKAVANNAAPSITLNWTNPSGNATGFTILRSTDKQSFSPIATLTAATTTYTDTDVRTTTTYYYRIETTTADSSADSAIFSTRWPRK